MDQSKPNFNMTLPSNSCLDKHPNNHGSKYVIELDETINLHGKWKVALTELRCKFPIYTIPKGAKVLMKYIDLPIYGFKDNTIFFPNGGEAPILKPERFVFSLMEETYVAIMFSSLKDAVDMGFNNINVFGEGILRPIHAIKANQDKLIQYRVCITDFNDTINRPNGNFIARHGISLGPDRYSFRLSFSGNSYPTISAALPNTLFKITFKSRAAARRVGFNIQTIYGFDAVTGSRRWSLPDDKSVEFEITYKTSFDDVSVKTSEYTLAYNDLYFSDTLAIIDYINEIQSLPFVLYLHEDKIKFDSNPKFTEVLFSHQLQYILGFDGTTPPIFTARFKPRLNSIYNHMYVYSNIADFTQVGETLAPLLRHINVKNNTLFGREYVYVPKVPMYVDVSPSAITKIEINIRTNTGEFIPFNITDVTSINVHFKQV